MIVIVAGGRDHTVTLEEGKEVRRLLEELNATEVVSGAAPGVDTWAIEKLHYPYTVFNAQWDKYGKAAGPIRNGHMASYADALIALPGGKGTANMIKQARAKGLKVYTV